MAKSKHQTLVMRRSLNIKAKVKSKNESIEQIKKVGEFQKRAKNKRSNVGYVSSSNKRERFSIYWWWVKLIFQQRYWELPLISSERDRNNSLIILLKMDNPENYLNHSLNTSVSKQAYTFCKSTRQSLAKKVYRDLLSLVLTVPSTMFHLWSLKEPAASELAPKSTSRTNLSRHHLELIKQKANSKLLILMRSHSLKVEIRWSSDISLKLLKG